MQQVLNDLDRSVYHIADTRARCCIKLERGDCKPEDCETCLTRSMLLRSMLTLSDVDTMYCDNLAIDLYAKYHRRKFVGKLPVIKFIIIFCVAAISVAICFAIISIIIKYKLNVLKFNAATRWW